MQKLKRILALLGVILLVGLYAVTFVLGITASPATQGLLLASLVCTVVIPCLLYAILLVAKILGGNSDTQEKETSND